MSVTSQEVQLTRTSTGQQFNLGVKGITQMYSNTSYPSTPLLGPTSLTTNSITAHAGGGAGSAVLLTTTYNVITVSATALDSVILPVAIVNQYMVIVNTGVASVAVYPATSGTINGGTATSGYYTLAAGASVILNGTSVLNWNTSYPTVVMFEDNGATLHKHTVNEPISLLSAISQTSMTITNSAGQVLYINPDRIKQYTPFFTALSGAAGVTTATITAHSGGGQSSAVAMTTLYNIVTTCAAFGDSVKLPVATVGGQAIVLNSGVYPLAVFPVASSSINGQPINISVILYPGEQAIFTGTSITSWVSSNPVQTRMIYDYTGGQNAVYDIQESATTLAFKISAAINQRNSALVPYAANATATLTAAQVAGGLITCVSTAAVALTLPTGTLLGTQLNAFAGMTFKLIVNNTGSSSSGVITMVAGTNNVLSDYSTQIQTATASVTPAAVTPLTVAVGATGMAEFTFLFSSPTACTFSRTA